MCKKYGKLLCILVSIFLVVGLLGACAKDDPKDTTVPVEQEEIVLRVSSPMSGEDRLNLMRASIEKYEDKYPHVTIEYTTEEGPQFDQNLRMTFSAGIGVEIPYVGDYQQQMLMRHDYLLDMTDIVKDRGWLDKQAPGAIEYFNLRTPGRYYSVPFLQSSGAMYYNKDIFSELNLEPPKDFKEYEKIMEKVKEAGYIPFEAGGVQAYHWNFMLESIIYGTVPKADIDKWYYLEETTTAFEEGFILALEYFEQWVKLGYFRDDAISIDYNDVPTLYAQGDVAMVLDGDWRINIMADTGIPTGVFVVPQIDKSLPHVITGSPHGAFAINANISEAKIKAAADFIDIFHEQEVIEMWAEKGFPVTVRYDVSKIDLPPLAVEYTKAIQNSGIGFYMANSVPGILDVWAKEVQRLALQEITPEECWNNINKGYEELKAEYLESAE